MLRPASNGSRSSTAPAPRPGRRGPGLFVPQHVVAAASCITVGVVAGVLVWLAPAVWLSVSAGVAVAGLALALYGLWRGHTTPEHHGRCPEEEVRPGYASRD